MKDALLSIIIPAFNEEENIPITSKVVLEIMLEAEIPCELIFVSDGSKDKTFEKILEQCKKNPMIRGIEFSRNFGKEAAIRAGLAKAKGGCAVVMDCDLQHPPKTIVQMYEQWKNGYEIVEGIKNSRGSESLIYKMSAGNFYKIISALTGFDMQNTSDFKLLDRRVINTLLDMPERRTFFRAMSFWVGFKSCQVTYDVAERTIGTTKWSFLSLARYAVSNIISFSTKPLTLVSYIGVIALFAGGALAIQTIIRWTLGKATEGFTTVILLLLLLCGGILLGLGIIGNYIAAIYEEVKCRPRYLIRLDTDKISDDDV